MEHPSSGITAYLQPSQHTLHHAPALPAPWLSQISDQKSSGCMAVEAEWATPRAVGPVFNPSVLKHTQATLGDPKSQTWRKPLVKRLCQAKLNTEKESDLGIVIPIMLAIQEAEPEK